MEKGHGRHLIEHLLELDLAFEKVQQDYSIRFRTFGSRLTPATAQQIQKNVSCQGNSIMWVVAEGDRYFFAFVVTDDGIGSGWLAADSLTELRQYLPSGLVRSHIQPSETPGIIEIWIPEVSAAVIFRGPGQMACRRGESHG